MAKIAEIVGDKLIGQKGEVDTKDLECEILGIYFSAHWCPPCRGFTPVLIKFYNDFKHKNKFEVVFVSSDRDETAFKEYFGEMPWHAIPFGDKAKVAEVKEKYGISGIPTLVVVDAKTGETINANGRGDVQSCSPDKFPFERK